MINNRYDNHYSKNVVKLDNEAIKNMSYISIVKEKLSILTYKIKLLDQSLFKQRELLLRHDGRMTYFTLTSHMQRFSCLAILCVAILSTSSFLFGYGQRNMRLEREHDLIELARFLDSFRNELIKHQHIYDTDLTHITAEDKIKLDNIKQSIQTVLRNLEQPTKIIDFVENTDFANNGSRYFSDRRDLTKQIMALEQHNENKRKLVEEKQNNIIAIQKQLNSLQQEFSDLHHAHNNSLLREENLKGQIVSREKKSQILKNNIQQLHYNIAKFNQELSLNKRDDSDNAHNPLELVSVLNSHFNDMQRELLRNRDVITHTADELSNISGVTANLDNYQIPADILQQQIDMISDTKEKQLSLLEDMQQFSDHHLLTVEGIFNEIGIDPNILLKNKGIAMQVGGPFAPITALENIAGKAYSATQRLQQSIDRSQALNEILSCLPLDSPVNTMNVSSEFGQRIDPFTKKLAQHNGTDFAGWRGIPIYAPAAGVVTRAGTNGAYGRFVEIDHGCGITTRYGHLHKILVKRGEKLDYRAKIGKMGNTGRSTGTHLHYEIRLNNKPINPRKFLQAGRYVYQRQNTG